MSAQAFPRDSKSYKGISARVYIATVVLAAIAGRYPNERVDVEVALRYASELLAQDARHEIAP